MRRMLLAMVCAALASPVLPQDFSGLARLDVAQSQVRDAGTGIAVTLYLSQAVPYRVFTLEEPARLVLDFREVDFRGASRAALLNADGAVDLRFGALRPGWSRLVIDLAGPMVVTEAGMAVDTLDGTADLRVLLRAASAAEFAAASGAPPDPDWDLGVDLPAALEAVGQQEDGPVVVVIDPGHGGIDPGAERAGVIEADVMLQLALELSEALARAGGFAPVLTREADIFVPLAERMTLARAANADVLLSLHADALDETTTRGASVYTLSAEAQDQASERMAERHDRGDLLAGVDLSGQDDTVATVLMDLARLETGPSAERLAQSIVTSLGDAGARMNSRPRREAQLAVLNAADFPSVLIEVGFLSNDTDRALIASAEGRAVIVAGLVQALQRWRADEEARAPLIRQ
ncbi:N-acetylmuramoyl-L-alanine amidase [Flavimaricola marinus]|uniref:N-acetylmuramoyl-L-alanine amidase n=1 Tax=Flavimaricola marinus TaxID=1819565 RepID=A0A238LG81_9RHOB|nr:N-acetylmuramoyl-L-alanine amidase [Flavimaricola marinus]SMY07900.1 N-acetylmuramoyl-L-alanine amidase AmiC precursor [Flavimaricola marinus]